MFQDDESATRLLRVEALAEEVLGDRDTAIKWLNRPRNVFDGVCAMEVIKTEAGADLVEEILKEIDSDYLE